MKITLHTIPICELVKGFADNKEEGVVGYHGKLNIRPPYQREFVYNDAQQIAVINSIFKSFPLNVMYWVKNAQGTFELLDGQQRTLSICRFAQGNLQVYFDKKPKAFGNLTEAQKNKFLNYNLQVYICEDGDDDERLAWFEIINMAGEVLTKQELRNATYTGAWITDAKRYFSKSDCPAKNIGDKYLSGKYNRQECLETILDWISPPSNQQRDKIAEYMAEHQFDENADREWQYFQQVIAWVKSLFTVTRSEMKNVDWGELYNKHKDEEFSATKLEEEVSRLMEDSDVTNKRGIYEYVLSGDERKLSIRAFDKNMAREAYERQTKAAQKKGVSNCPICAKAGRSYKDFLYPLSQMEADHIKPWSKGGRTIAANCQMLCRDCNHAKGNR